MNDGQAFEVVDQVHGFAACREDRQPRPAVRALDRRRVRRCLTAIDDCLDFLELLHVRDQTPPARSACGAVIEALVSRGIGPPPAVRGALDTYALHEALLDWQEFVLEDLLRLGQQPLP